MLNLEMGVVDKPDERLGRDIGPLTLDEGQAKNWEGVRAIEAVGWVAYKSNFCHAFSDQGCYSYPPLGLEISMSEEWVRCREFPDHYEISNTGRVRRAAAATGARVGRVRKGVKSKAGYVQFMLSVANQQSMRDGHRLVADAFLGPISEGTQVNHKNGQKDDNRLDNLELVSSGENRAHSYRVLGIAPNRALGAKNTNAKFDFDVVLKIRAAYKEAGGQNASALARQFNVSRQTIYRIGNSLTRAFR